MKHRYILLVMLAAISVLPYVAMAGDSMELEVHKGKRVSLPDSATSVVVANPDIADVQVVSPRVLYIYGKAVGETSVFAIDADENTIFDATVSVTHDISRLAREVQRIAPDADVTFKTVDSGLVMEGNAATVSEAEDIRKLAATFLTKESNNPDAIPQTVVNMIKTGGSDQVMLKVKIVEMARNDLKNLGVNMQDFLNHGNNTGFQLLQGVPATFNANNALQPEAGNSNTQVFGFAKKGGLTLSGVIDALETQGLANILAEPTLTTTSGQAASFLAGGQFPLPVVQASAGAAPTITIQYQPFGVSLKFTPVVMAHDRISLTVAPEVSTLNFNTPVVVSTVSYPILEVRQASSVVELGSGDSFMLAGLLENDMSNTVTKFPGLGDLPVLGALFRSTSFQNNQTDLVILVTPYIVHPVAQASKLQTPLDGYKPTSDLQLLMEGNLYQQQPMSTPGAPVGTSASAPVSVPDNSNNNSNNGSGATTGEPVSPISSMPKLNGAGGFIME